MTHKLTDNELLYEAYRRVQICEDTNERQFSTLTNELGDYIVNKLTSTYIKGAQNLSPEESNKQYAEYNKAVEDIVVYLSEYLSSITDESVNYRKV